MNDKLEQMDIYIELYLDLLYCNALIRKNDKELFECLGFLAMAEKLIKEKLVSEFKVINPRIYSVSEKILILLSSICIANADFVLSIQYQILCLKLCHKELLTIIDLDEAVDLDKLNPNERHHLMEIFINIFLVFFHRGVCEENKGDYTLATDCFIDAKWFAFKFIQNLCSHCVRSARNDYSMIRKSTNFIKVNTLATYPILEAPLWGISPFIPAA